MKFFRSIRLPLAGLAAIAVLSGCGDNGNPVAPSPQLDTTPPPAPENLTLSSDASGHPVLVWTESAAADLAGYRVYLRSDVTGGPFVYVEVDNAILTNNYYRLPSVTSSIAASYRVRSVDTSGNKSPFSATADIIIPALTGSGGPDPFAID